MLLLEFSKCCFCTEVNAILATFAVCLIEFSLIVSITMQFERVCVFEQLMLIAGPTQLQGLNSVGAGGS